jgi:hypothetical protein
MTWRDLPDDPQPIPAKTPHAHNLNAFTVAEAEEQWFFLPEAPRPRVREGLWLPLSAELVPGYSTSTALSSQLHRQVIGDLQARTGDGSHMVEIHYLPQETREALTGRA